MRHVVAGFGKCAFAGFGEGVFVQSVGEAQGAGTVGEAREMFVQVDDAHAAGGIVFGGADACHGFEEAHGVLEAGVEGTDVGLVAREEGAVEEDGGHWGR